MLEHVCASDATVATTMDSRGFSVARTGIAVCNGKHLSVVRVEIVIEGVRVIGHVCDCWDTQLKLCLGDCLFLERWWAVSSMTASAFIIVPIQPSACGHINEQEQMVEAS